MSRARRPGGPAARDTRRAPGASPAPRDPLDARLAAHEGWIAWGLACAWAATMLAVCVTKLRYFLYDDFDLALFAQATRGVLRGDFTSSIRGMPWLADHSSFVLVPLAPLAAVIPAPLLLVTLQCAALALGAVIVHRLARRETASPSVALALAFAWLLQPALGYVALFEFHPETLATPALLLAWDAWRAGRRGRMLAAACVALLCKEDVAFSVLGLALAVVLARRRAGLADALTLAAPALVVSVVSFALLKPLGRAVVDYGRLYQAWGPTTAAALRAMTGQPARVVAALFTTPGDAADSAAKLAWWPQLLGPWLFVPLVAPLVWLPAAPIVLEHLLSGRIEQHVIVYQYPALLMPWLAAGAVAALAWLARPARAGGAPRPGPARAAALAIVLAAALAQWAWGPFTAQAGALPLARPQRLAPDGFDRAMRAPRERAVAAVGARDGIVSGFEVMTRFHDRAHVFAAHHVLGGTYTFSDVPYPLPREVTAGVVDTGTPMLFDALDVESPRRWQTLARANHLTVVAADGDLTLWLRDAPDTLALVTPGAVTAPLARRISYEERLRLLGVELPAAPVPAGGVAPLTFCWQRHGALAGLAQVALALRPVGGGEQVAVRNRIVGYGLWPVDEWPEDVVMRERYRWVLPDDLPAGRYRVQIAALERGERGLRPFGIDQRPDPDGFLDLGELTVGPRATGRGR